MSDKGHFDSQKDSSYNGTLKRVLIVSANNEASSRLGAGYRDSVANQLAIKIRTKGPAVEVLSLQSDELDATTSVENAGRHFGAEQVLQLAVTHIDETSHTMTSPELTYSAATAGLSSDNTTTTVVGFTMAFRLTDLGSSKVVWRGSVKFDRAPTSESAATQLYNQLLAASLL